MDNVIIEKIKREIADFDGGARVEKIGHVISVGDGVSEISGLSNVMMSEMLVFDDTEGKTLEESLGKREPVYGLVLSLEEDTVKAVVLGDSSRVTEGMVVKSLGRTLSIPVTEDLIGRVVNPLIEVLDGKGKITSSTEYPIERVACGVIDRKPVDTPLHTGNKAVDAVVPIGRGQRELIIGDRATGKTTIGIDAILNQMNEDPDNRPICIYVAIGQKESKTARIVKTLKDHGALEYTVVVSASAATPATLQFLAPFAGAAIGEYFMEKGKDALIIYDDLSKHAVAYRELSLLLRRPPGREAYPGDIFYLHSRLLERAVRLSDEKGGGSLTALPIIETQEGDVSSYIPTNVISITDGQIYLDIDLFNKGVRPAVNVGLSVTRVGSNAQTKAMKKVASRIRLELAQFRELEAFMQFSGDLDSETKNRIATGERLSKVLTQDKALPMSFERQVPVIYAAVNGYFSTVSVDDIPSVEKKLLEYIDREGKEILQSIRSEKDITSDTETALKSALEKFKDTHKELFSLSS
jgi:F-type H+-transporting ATPase subunit alpha|tara:strand:+ start:27215 stop:28786 length:1572 start_codon:yes stop_codon:yes gene_type:complete